MEKPKDLVDEFPNASVFRGPTPNAYGTFFDSRSNDLDPR